MEKALRGKIAITAVAGRFPNARSPLDLWQAVLSGADLIDDLRDEDLLAAGVSSGELASAEYVRRGAFLKDTDLFDAAFFSCSAREALRMDPQQRLFLELCHEALELSGNSRDSMPRCGVFAGTRQSTWRPYVDQMPDGSAADEYLVLGGNSSDSFATRVAYKLGCTGPALNIRTFCSGSLVAVHLACQQLLAAECDIALVGGSCIRFPSGHGYAYYPGGVLSRDGRCYTFDARANGTIFSDAVAVIVLRRLRDALEASEPIHAVIAGSAINNDGSRRAGFGAPSVAGQVEVVSDALRRAEIAPAQIGLLEAHGTGTPIGDGIEFRALERVFHGSQTQHCALGSVKTNVGHTDCVSGLTGLIKAVLAVETQIVPPTINFETANPQIALDKSAFYIPRSSQSWSHLSSDRFAGISSFGIGGTNAHVVIQAAPLRISPPSNEAWHIVPLSAKTDAALEALGTELKHFLSQRVDLNFADVAFTLQHARQAFGKRRVVLARTRADLLEGLQRAGGSKLITPTDAGEQAEHVALASSWLDGKTVDWSTLYRGEARLKVALPTYRFARTSHQAPRAANPVRRVHSIASLGEENMIDLSMNAKPFGAKPDAAKLELTEPAARALPPKCEPEVKALFAQALKLTERELQPEDNLLELGADSLLLFEVLEPIRERFGVKLTLRQFFVEIPTVRQVSAYIERHAVQVEKEETAPDRADRGATSLGGVHEPVLEMPATALPVAPSTRVDAQRDRTFQIVQEQLHLMQQQLALLSAADSQSDAVVSAPAFGGLSQPAPEKPAATAAIDSDARRESFFWMNRSPPAVESPERKKYLATFVPEYTHRTKRSKKHAQIVRTKIADSRSGIGFKSSLKEILYPIVCDRFEGAKITDIDGNDYVDMTMGFGVHLFGHNPRCVQDALCRHVGAGFGVGTRCETALSVAGLITELTGMERVAFVNSGTEAVMNAVRVARAATGKDGIVIFSTSYHGHWDAVLAAGALRKGTAFSRPLAVGIPDAMVRDVAVHEFGTEAALRFVQENAGTLAAVLVEPVPTRDPGLANSEYLRSLREVSEQSGVLLIFDEIVTGFRCHPGGVQELFGVKADIATYGKTIGGGMPLGVVAGRSGMLDSIDGGVWNFGDGSFPSVEPTFFGGTFFQHPLAMTAALACLQELKHRGPAFQADLNAKTERFCSSLNQLFSRFDLSIKANAFSSFFRLIHRENFDLLYYNLMKRGIYIWEWRCWFLSDAHTDEQLNFVLTCFEDSIKELRDGGVLTLTSGNARTDACARV